MAKVLRKKRLESEKDPDMIKFEGNIKKAMGEQSQSKQNGKFVFELESIPNSQMQMSARKFKTDDAQFFDLEFVTPMMQTYFSNQLTTSHYPGRK